MQIISPAAKFFMDVVGKQERTEGQTYRLMTYVLQCPVEDGVLLYHTMTCCMVLLTRDEAAHLTEQQELIDHWFLVPLQHDDRKSCKQLREFVRLFQPPAKSITNYTILTTTGCNARCFYCYEKGTEPITMTDETADKVSRYIMSHRGGEEVHLSWFGGEPLFNIQVIDQICSVLRENNVPFRSKMTSNGYLFNEEMVRRAKELWQLRKVQITLDGTEQTYNRIKRYIYGNVNAFNRVLNNIELLTNAGIRVAIRLNVDKHNISEMSQLVSFLHQRFGANDHLSIYSHELLGERTPGHHAFIYDQRMQLDQQIKKCGYRKKQKLQKDIKLNYCMADNDQSVIISPAGFLGKCEHFVDREFFGHIDSEKSDESVLLKFKERPADVEACATCPCYPQCFRLQMCENGFDCTSEWQKMKIHNTKEAMKEYYKEIKSE